MWPTWGPAGAGRTLAIRVGSLGAKMGICKSLKVQGFMIDPVFRDVLNKIKLGRQDGNLGDCFCIIDN